MVKADGYGHGMIPIVRFAALELGIKQFGCATLGEALTLREELPDLDTEIYVFSDVQVELKDCTDFYLHRRIIPVLSNFHDLEFILDHKDFRHFPLCLKFNTGMNRLGLDYESSEQVITKILKSGRREIFHLMTHYASSSKSMEEDAQNLLQKSRFENLIKEIQAAGIKITATSTANTGAISQQSGTLDTHLRPGLMMYGPTSLAPELRPQSLWRGKLISQLETYIIKVFPIKKGECIGYGATQVQSDGVIAIIALGYGDGFSTRFMGARLNHQGHEGVVTGRVNMDMAHVHFPMSALKDLKVGDKFIVWGHDPGPFYRLSEETKTLTYELFCQLTSRVPRVHRTSP